MTTVFDYMNPTNYHREPDELLRFWLFCMFVAGKRADVQAKKLAEFERIIPLAKLPDACERKVGGALQKVKSGKYRLLTRGICQTASQLRVNPGFLKIAPVDLIESIHGVGCKTSRFFLVHSRKDVRVAVLDTHVLQWMASKGIDVPDTPPTRAQYHRLEKACLKLYDKMGLTPAEADIAIWRERTVSKPVVQDEEPDEN